MRVLKLVFKQNKSMSPSTNLLPHESPQLEPSNQKDLLDQQRKAELKMNFQKHILQKVQSLLEREARVRQEFKKKKRKSSGR